MDLSTLFIAIFTGVLAVATIWNMIITQGLLRQSKETSKQSRAAFLADMILTAIRLEQETVEPKLTAFGEFWKKPEIIHKDIAEIFGDVDENLKKDFLEALNNFYKRARQRKETDNNQAKKESE